MKRAKQNDLPQPLLARGSGRRPRGSIRDSFPFIIYLGLLLFPFITQAQTDLFGEQQVTKTDQEVYLEGAQEQSKVLIIPFEERMFQCDIMRELTTYNKLRPEQVFHRFRNGIQMSLQAALRDSMETQTFLATDSIRQEDLVLIYEQLGYTYAAIPQKKTNKKNDSDKRRERSGIERGQVTAERDTTPRYMNAKIQDASVLARFHQMYGTDRFIFINQMDIRMDLSDPETAFLNPKRIIAVHYTVFGKNGKQLAGGLAEQHFAANENDINTIMARNLHRLSFEMVGALRAKKKEDADN